MKDLRDALSYQSETLGIRTRVTPKIALKWLRKRKDVVKYIPSIVGAHGMGAGVFCSYVAGLVCNPNRELQDLMLERSTWGCCIKCVAKSVKQFKINVRFGTTDQPWRDSEIFDWQYCTHMLGRFDHEAFSDKADLMERTDYDGTLPVKNVCFGLKEEFDRRYEEEIRKEGIRFGSICADNLRASGQPFHHLTEMALTKVPTGSMPSSGIKVEALAEVDKQNLNKKLAIIYFTKGEEDALKWAQRHARSNWMWKLEISKLRNLVPGSLGYYLASARVSAYGESRFLGTMENVPLMWSDARKAIEDKEFAEWQRVGYVACRDYKNYNICHRHDRMQMFYMAAAETAHWKGEHALAEELEGCAKCLDDVGVYVDGQYNKWEFGLQSGWAHTMMFHCTHNSSAGRVAAEMVKELTGWSRYKGQHQGDDSREIWSEPMAAVLAQSILDAGGQIGQADKQHFAREKDSWSEFLRVWYKRDLVRGSAYRTIGGLVSADSQHEPYEGGSESTKTINDIVNTIWRRQGGKIGLRKSDVTGLMDYWATSNREFKRTGERGDWRILFSDRGGLSSAPFPEMRWSVTGGKFSRKLRYDVEPGPIMKKRAARNLEVVGRVSGIGRYAAEYAQDLVECSVLISVDVGEANVMAHKSVHATEQQIYEQKVMASGARHNCLRGKGGWRDEDKFAELATINYLFAGSERTARAAVADGINIVVDRMRRMGETIRRGLDLIAGRTSKINPRLNRKLICHERYWKHVELLLQERNSKEAIDQHSVGRLIAEAAIADGEWL
jgi:hypothetical protein